MEIRKALSRITATQRALREIDDKIPSQTAHCLMEIALRPGMTMQQLSEATGLSQSSCSRNVAALSKWHRLGTPGYDLVEAIEDPAERRRKIMFLTGKGRDRVRKILLAYDPDLQIEDIRMPTAKEWVSGAYRKAMADGAR